MKNQNWRWIIISVVLWSSVLASAEEGKLELIKVACVGDSIIFGFGIKDKKSQSYPAQLAFALGDRWSVGNFGRNDRTVLFSYGTSSTQFLSHHAKVWCSE